MTEYTQLSNDGYDWRNETVDLGSWTPRELQQHGEQSDGCRGRDNDGISGGRTDDNRHCHDVDKSSRDLLLDSYYWWRDHNKTETSCDEVPFRRSRAPSWILPVDNIKQSNGNITWAGDEHVHDPEAFPRWRDKPRPQTNNDEIGRWELESGGIAGVARHRRTSSPGGACCGAARLGYRSRGAPGRRPISREGARQLHTSKRLHHVSETIARKRETAIQKRNDVIQANVREEY